MWYAVDESGRLSPSRAERIVAHLSFDAARDDPSPTGAHPLVTEFDRRRYPVGRRVSDDEIATVNLVT